MHGINIYIRWIFHCITKTIAVLVELHLFLWVENAFLTLDTFTNNKSSTSHQNDTPNPLSTDCIRKTRKLLIPSSRTKSRRNSSDRSKSAIPASIISQQIESINSYRKPLKLVVWTARNRCMWIGSLYDSVRATRNVNIIKIWISDFRRQCVVAYCC